MPLATGNLLARNERLIANTVFRRRNEFRLRRRRWIAVLRIGCGRRATLLRTRRWV